MQFIHKSTEAVSTAQIRDRSRIHGTNRSTEAVSTVQRRDRSRTHSTNMRQRSCLQHIDDTKFLFKTQVRDRGCVYSKDETKKSYSRTSKEQRPYLQYSTDKRQKSYS